MNKPTKRTIAVGLAALVATGILYLRSKSNYESSNPRYGYQIVSKAEGILGERCYIHTRSRDINEDWVLNNGILSGMSIFDGGVFEKRDGKVNRIETFPYLFGEGKTLVRDNNYNEFEKAFDDADKHLAEKKEIFKERIKWKTY